MQKYYKLVIKIVLGTQKLQLIWETASPMTHKSKIVNESLMVFAFYVFCAF